MNFILDSFIKLYYTGAIVTFIVACVSTVLYAKEYGAKGFALIIALFHPYNIFLNIIIAGGSWFALQYPVGDLKKLLK